MKLVKLFNRLHNFIQENLHRNFFCCCSFVTLNILLMANEVWLPYFLLYNPYPLLPLKYRQKIFVGPDSVVLDLADNTDLHNSSTCSLLYFY